MVSPGLLDRNRFLIAAGEASESPSTFTTRSQSSSPARWAGVSGATQCLEPALEEPLYRAMLDPQVVTVYDPQAKVLALIEWSEKRAWVLRSFD